MKTSAIDHSQRKAARIAGLIYVLSLVTVISVTYGIVSPVVTGADPGQIAQNILAHETLFRAGIAGYLLYCIEVLVLAAALYVVFRTVDPLFALLLALGRLIHGVTWLLITIDRFTALRLLTQTEFADGLPPDQLPVLARLYLSGFDQYYVGLLFWALGSTVGAWLWLRSRYAPRGLAAFGILASGWAVACTSIFFVFPSFQRLVGLSWFDVPLVLFEVLLGLLLVFRGLPSPGTGATSDVGAAAAAS